MHIEAALVHSSLAPYLAEPLLLRLAASGQQQVISLTACSMCAAVITTATACLLVTVPSSLAGSLLPQPQDLLRSFAVGHPRYLPAYFQVNVERREKPKRRPSLSNLMHGRTSPSWLPAALQQTRWGCGRLEDCFAGAHVCSQKALRPRAARDVLVCKHGLVPKECAMSQVRADYRRPQAQRRLSLLGHCSG